jgi:hypothetical protein
LKGVFALIDERSAELEVEFKVSVNVVEVYNEQVAKAMLFMMGGLRQQFSKIQ